MNDAGKKEAEKAAAQLVKKLYNDLAHVAVVSSPLGRALETAQAFVDHRVFARLPRKPTIEKDKRFIEISFGSADEKGAPHPRSWDLKTREQISEELGKEELARAGDFRQGNLLVASPYGGESFIELFERTYDAIRALDERLQEEGKVGVVFGHGVVGGAAQIMVGDPRVIHLDGSYFWLPYMFETAQPTELGDLANFGELVKQLTDPFAKVSYKLWSKLEKFPESWTIFAESELERFVRNKDGRRYNQKRKRLSHIRIHHILTRLWDGDSPLSDTDWQFMERKTYGVDFDALHFIRQGLEFRIQYGGHAKDTPKQIRNFEENLNRLKDVIARRSEVRDLKFKPSRFGGSVHNEFRPVKQAGKAQNQGNLIGARKVRINPKRAGRVSNVDQFQTHFRKNRVNFGVFGRRDSPQNSFEKLLRFQRLPNGSRNDRIGSSRVDNGKKGIAPAAGLLESNLAPDAINEKPMLEAMRPEIKDATDFQGDRLGHKYGLLTRQKGGERAGPSDSPYVGAPFEGQTSKQAPQQALGDWRIRSTVPGSDAPVDGSSGTPNHTHAQSALGIGPSSSSYASKYRLTITQNKAAVKLAHRRTEARSSSPRPGFEGTVASPTKLPWSKEELKERSMAKARNGRSEKLALEARADLIKSDERKAVQGKEHQLIGPGDDVESGKLRRSRKQLTEEPIRSESKWDALHQSSVFGPFRNQPATSDTAYMVQPAINKGNAEPFSRRKAPIIKAARETVPALVRKPDRNFLRSSVNSNMDQNPISDNYNLLIKNMQLKYTPLSRSEVRAYELTIEVGEAISFKNGDTTVQFYLEWMADEAFPVIDSETGEIYFTSLETVIF